MKRFVLILILTILTVFSIGNISVNAENCAEGYTQIKDGNCYNPNTSISYSIDNDFYIKGKRCGEDCDFEGRNCTKGVCNVADCPIGYKNIGHDNYYLGVCVNKYGDKFLGFKELKRDCKKIIENILFFPMALFLASAYGSNLFLFLIACLVFCFYGWILFIIVSSLVKCLFSAISKIIKNIRKNKP